MEIDDVVARMEGPVVDPESGAHRFIVRGEIAIRFWVVPEERGGEAGWGVQIEGLPVPSIAHAHPWESMEAARDAALRAVHEMLVLERVQREDREGNRSS